MIFWWQLTQILNVTKFLRYHTCAKVQFLLKWILLQHSFLTFTWLCLYSIIIWRTLWCFYLTKHCRVFWLANKLFNSFSYLRLGKICFNIMVNSAKLWSISAFVIKINIEMNVAIGLYHCYPLFPFLFFTNFLVFAFKTNKMLLLRQTFELVKINQRLNINIVFILRLFLSGLFWFFFFLNNLWTIMLFIFICFYYLIKFFIILVILPFRFFIIIIRPRMFTTFHYKYNVYIFLIIII